MVINSNNKGKLTLINIFIYGLLFLIILRVFISAISQMPYRERVFPFSSKMDIFIILSGAVILSVIFAFIYKKITVCSSKFVVPFVFGCVALIQFALLFIQINPTTDCFTTIDEAMAMVEKQNGILYNNVNYFARYTNNYFFTVLMYFYFRIVKIIGVDYLLSAVILNIILIDITIWLCYRMVGILFDTNRAKGILVLFLFCPTTYLFIYFPYTNTFSAPFVVGILYTFICIIKENHKRKRFFLLIALAICSVIGILIRPTTAIPLIAIVLYSILKVFQKKWNIKVLLLNFIMLTIIISGIMLGMTCIKSYLKNPDNKEGFPATHWVMMGLSYNGMVNSEDVVYTQGFKNRQDKVDANIQVIKDRIDEKGILGLYNLSVFKLYSVWGDGTDGFTGMTKSVVRHNKISELIYGEGNGFVIFYSQIYRIVMLFFILVMTAFKIKSRKTDDMLCIALSLLGIMLFLLGWENNVKHNICFIPVMLLLAESGVNIQASHTNKKIISYCVLILFVISDIIFISNKPSYVDNREIYRDYSYYKNTTRNVPLSALFSSDDISASQYFAAYKPINTIAVKFSNKDINSQTKYNLTLRKQHTVIAERTVTINDIDTAGFYYIDCNIDAGEFALDIDTDNKDSDFSPLIMRGKVMKHYKNTRLESNENKSNNTLVMNAYYETEKAMLTFGGFIFILLLNIVLQMLTFLTILINDK